MTIAVGGDIGATLNMRDALLNTQTIMTNDMKFPTAVSAWNTDQPLLSGNDGLSGSPVKVKVNYPFNNVGNGFVQPPTYTITDLNGTPLNQFKVNLFTGQITNTNYIDPNQPIGTIQFQVRQSGLEAEHIAELNNLSTVIDDLTSLVGAFQTADNAFLNSGAIS